MCRWQDHFAPSLHPVPRLSHARLLSPHFWVMNLFSFTLNLRVAVPDLYDDLLSCDFTTDDFSDAMGCPREQMCVERAHAKQRIARNEHAATANYYFCPTINI